MTHETYQRRDLVSFSFNEFPKFFFAKRFLLISNYHEATKHDIYIYIYILNTKVQTGKGHRLLGGVVG